MIEAVFISDLHLHPDDHDIQERFNQFVKWAKSSVKSIYILGDFFHAWAGDDSINDWSRAIAAQLSDLKQQGISIFYMHGNRDFLLGKTFAHLAGWTVLSEPAFINLGSTTTMLAHGDRYCTKDVAHQRFRLLTRNKLFCWLFLSLPLNYREQLVNKVRARSEGNYNKPAEQMDVVTESVLQHMTRHKVTQLIHGHTHKPDEVIYENNSLHYKRYVLSDWDDRPRLLCYDNTQGFYFDHIED